jgi:hypothetical protein
VDLRPFSVSGDRAGFIARCVATKKTQAGITPTADSAHRDRFDRPIVIG